MTLETVIEILKQMGVDSIMACQMDELDKKTHLPRYKKWKDRAEAFRIAAEELQNQVNIKTLLKKKRNTK